MQTTNNDLKDFNLSVDVKQKSSKDYGKKIIDQVDKYINSTYFLERNKRFELNEKMAAGRMDMTVFKELFDMANNQKNYAKIIWKSIMIVNTIISRMVGRWMQTREKAIVKGVDVISVNKKKTEVDTAEFYMQFKQQLMQAQQASGIPLIPQQQFVPEDKDHLDIWTKYELHLPEEYLYRKGINTVLDSNGWGFSGVNRRRIKHDSATFGFVGTYTWADKNGKIHVDWVNPKNAIYSYSEREDFSDCGYMGQIISLKLSQIRDRNFDITEKELFDEVVPYANEWQQSDKLTWTDTWNGSYSRPYDEWNVDIVMFELRSLDNDNYSMKVTSNGNLLIEKNDTSKKLNGDVKTERKTVWNVYQGIYVKKSKFLLKWDLKENPIKPQDPNYSAYTDFSYSYYMYQNVNGRNLAIPEKIEEPVEQMILARLKIQQLVSQMRAAGLAIDIDAEQNIDLGTGEGALKPMQLKRVYDQTGNMYYRGKDAEGNRINAPYTELPNAGSVAQLQELITVYNFHLQVLRDEIGSNEQAEGQTAKPRTTNDNVQTALEVSFNASDYMNDSCLSCIQSTAKKIASLLHDSVEFGSKEYHDILQEKDVKERVYDVQVEMASTDEEINSLMQQVGQFVMSNPEFILYVDPLKIRTIALDSLDLASVYFRRAQQKAIQGQRQNAQELSSENAKNQAAAGEQVAAAQMKADQQRNGFDVALAKEKQKEIILQGVFGVYQKGLTIPEELKPLETEIIKNLALPLFAANAQMEQAASQMQHPMAQQQDGQEQENPQENMQEQGQEEPMQ